MDYYKKGKKITVSNLDCPIFQYKCSVILLLSFVLLIEALC